MSVTAVETTTQVLVHEKVVLVIDGFEAVVKARTARIKKAEANWFFERGEWLLSWVHVWGPVIRKSDGARAQPLVATQR